MSLLKVIVTGWVLNLNHNLYFIVEDDNERSFLESYG